MCPGPWAKPGTALLHSPNFSFGVHAFFRLAKFASRMCDAMEGYAPSVREAHHRYKLDSPSGTARRLAEIVVGEMSSMTEWALVDDPDMANPGILPVTASRIGENPGEHLLVLDRAGGPDRIATPGNEPRGVRSGGRGCGGMGSGP